MKYPKHVLLGVISTLLFALGFTHVAEQLDPVSRSLDVATSRPATLAAADTTDECAMVEAAD